MRRVESCVEWSRSKRAMMALDSKAGRAGSPKTSDSDVELQDLKLFLLGLGLALL